MIYKILLWINLGLLYVHELDAAYAREWRMMFIFKRSSDEAGHRIFTAAHLVLFIAVFYLMEYRFEFLYWFTNIFLFIHLFMHLAARKHRANMMNNLFSEAIILLMFAVSCTAILLKLNGRNM